MELSVTSESTSAIAASNAETEQDAEFPILRLIVRWRWAFFALLAIIQIATFNGRWRIGRDGALYRDVAHNLAIGNGYTYRGETEQHVYPGLPLLLAGIEKVFGPQDALAPTATLIIMALIGVATLVIIYQLAKLYLPAWLAVCVVTGVGINRIFLMQEHDMMTDVPFLLASMMALLGLAYFKKSNRTNVRVIGAIILAISLVAALLIRPTFWALAAAMVCASLIGLIVNSRRRWIYVSAFASLVVIALIWFAVDPRTRGSNSMGVYEQRAAARIMHFAWLNWHENVVVFGREHFPQAMIALDLPYIGYLFTPLIFAAGILLVRRSWVWGLYVAATLGVILVMGSVPRYFLMILPMLLAGWGLMLYALAHWVARTRYAFASQWVLIAGLVISTIPHLIKTAGFAMEQHGVDMHFKHRPFLEVYRGGKMKPIYDMSQQIRLHVPAKASVLSIEPRIMTFLSGRNVYDPVEYMSRRGGANMAKGMAKLRAIKGLSYVVFGKHVDQIIQMLIRTGNITILSRRPMARVAPMVLSKMKLEPPPELRTRVPSHRPATRPLTDLPPNPQKPSSTAESRSRNPDPSAEQLDKTPP